MLKASESRCKRSSNICRSMSEDQYAQEYECSFEAAVVGSYGRLLSDLLERKRISRCRGISAAGHHRPGSGTATASIWFAQQVPTKSA